MRLNAFTDTACELLSSENQTVHQNTLHFLECSHLEYCLHQYENYEAFIARDFVSSAAAAKKLRYSSIFRKFWNSEWDLRNRTEFLPFAEECCIPLAELKREYLFIHSAERLLNTKGFLLRYEAVLKSILHPEQSFNS